MMYFLHLLKRSASNARTPVTACRKIQTISSMEGWEMWHMTVDFIQVIQSALLVLWNGCNCI